MPGVSWWEIRGGVQRAQREGDLQVLDTYTEVKDEDNRSLTVGWFLVLTETWLGGLPVHDPDEAKRLAAEAGLQPADQMIYGGASPVG